MVPQVRLGAGIVLLRQQPCRSEQVDQLVEQVPGLRNAAHRHVRLDQPRGADVEAALQARQAVVVPVPENGGPHAELPFHRGDGVQEPLVVDIEQAGQPDVQDRRVQVRAVVGHGVGGGGVVPALAEHLVPDGGGSGRPGRLGIPAVPGGGAEGPVQRDPAHHLGVDVVPRCAARLPDAVVGLVPARQHGTRHLHHQVPVRRPTGIPAIRSARGSARRWGRTRPAGPGGPRRCRSAPAVSLHTRAGFR